VPGGPLALGSVFATCDQRAGKSCIRRGAKPRASCLPSAATLPGCARSPAASSDNDAIGRVVSASAQIGCTTAAARLQIVVHTVATAVIAAGRADCVTRNVNDERLAFLDIEVRVDQAAEATVATTATSDRCDVHADDSGRDGELIPPARLVIRSRTGGGIRGRCRRGRCSASDNEGACAHHSGRSRDGENPCQSHRDRDRPVHKIPSFIRD
jgi:hypothetical protein